MLSSTEIGGPTISYKGFFGLINVYEFKYGLSVIVAETNENLGNRINRVMRYDIFGEHVSNEAAGLGNTIWTGLREIISQA